jgi:hypothetical protein
MVCDAEAARIPRPYHQEAAALTKATQDALVAGFKDAAGEDSGFAHAAIGVFRNKYMGAQLAGPSGDTMGGQISNFGHFLSGELGVGTCTRHFYNNTNESYGVGMVYAGSCHVVGDPAGNDAMCIVPQHQTAELNYSNTAMNTHTAQIVVAGPNPKYANAGYSRAFDLDPISCRIRGDFDGDDYWYGTVNNPADGDIKVPR